MPGGQLLQLNVPNAGDCVLLDNQFIAVGRGGADIGLGIELVPGAQPGGYRVFFAAAHIQALTFLQGGISLSASITPWKEEEGSGIIMY